MGPYAAKPKLDPYGTVGKHKYARHASTGLGTQGAHACAVWTHLTESESERERERESERGHGHVDAPQQS